MMYALLTAGLLAALPASASTPRPTSPDEIALPYEADSAEEVAEREREDRETLERYAELARVVVTGRILTTRDAGGDELGVRIVTMLVKDRMRGKTPFIYEFRVDPPSLDPDRPSPRLVHGYDVLVFVDRSGHLVDGRALYALEGGWAWRNRREGTFLKPRRDRDWVEEMDPSGEYEALSLVEVRDRVTRRKRRR